MLIDAHQHFWDPAGAHDYPWLRGAFLPVRRAFSYDDLEPALQANGVDGTVLVQSWNSLDETREYLRIAAARERVLGVVGWADLTDSGLDATLSALKAGEGGRFLVGVRHLVQDEPDPAWILRDDVAAGLEVLAEHGLAYDLLGRTEHLAAFCEVVRRHRRVRFVLDHLGKPEIKDGRVEPWRTLMSALGSERDHVWCKLSGMITEADWGAWTAADLAPYVAHAVGVFGTGRCMFGTDWPVCLLAGSYEQTVDALRAALPAMGEAEREGIFGGNAAEAYRLPDLVRGGR